jgi:hypothetical protein
VREEGKAYPADEFEYGSDWQMADFMRAVGLEYPIDARGELLAGSVVLKLELGQSES